MIRLGGIHAVVVFSENPRKLAAWYRQAFVTQEVANQEDFVGLACGEVAIFIQRTSEGQTPGPGGIRPHFTVSDCRQAHDALVAAGARTLLPPTDLGDEIVAGVQDPEGNPLGLLEPREA
jgi:predicted enzyme related to lactoylglutathione lyase